MGYYHNNSRGYYDHRRINEEDVPESKHTIFIRGLPGSMSTDEIKDYFEDKIGPISFDFVKVSPDNSRLFVAVRFDSRDHAKSAYDRYKDHDLLGYRCELSWFKDIRRYAQYQQSQGNFDRGRGGYRGNRGGGYSGHRGRGGDRNRHDSNREDRDREKRRRSDSEKSSRSRSRSRKSSRSSSRSRSNSSHRSADSRNRSLERLDRTRDENKDKREPRSMSLESKKSDISDTSPVREERKKKKAKKEKRKRSPSSSDTDGHASSGDEKARTSSRRNRSASPVSGRGSPPPPPPMQEPPVKFTIKPKDSDLMIPPPSIVNAVKLATPASPPRSATAQMVHATAFSIGIESDEPPKRVLRKLTPPSIEPPVVIKKELFPAATVSTASNGKHQQLDPSHEEAPPKKRDRFDQPPPIETSPKMMFRENKPKTTPSAQRYPTLTRLFGEMKSFQESILSSVKAVPKEESGGFGVLRLSHLSTEANGDDEFAKKALREERLANLSEFELERFMARKKQLEGAFRNDCETYAFVTKKLLEKDAKLEQQLRVSFIMVLEDLEKQMMDKVDVFLESL